jgi:peroxiredoxin
MIIEGGHMKRCFLLVAGFAALISFQSHALSVGDSAPDFTLTATSDSSVTLSQSAGQVRVLFFFGCG